MMLIEAGAPLDHIDRRQLVSSRGNEHVCHSARCFGEVSSSASCVTTNDVTPLHLAAAGLHA
jgi:hypothetical protein